MTDQSPRAAQAGSENPLPPVQIVELTTDELVALQRDLEECVELESVRLRVDGRDESLTGDDRISRVFSMIAKGDSVAAQIYYRYGADAWCDTLMKRGAGVRLARMRIPVTG